MTGLICCDDAPRLSPSAWASASAASNSSRHRRIARQLSDRHAAVQNLRDDLQPSGKGDVPARTPVRS